MTSTPDVNQKFPQGDIPPMSEESPSADSANPYTWNSLTGTKDAALLQGQAEPGMWLRPSLVRALRGNCSRAALLGQLLYWSLQLAQEGDEREDGWFEYSIRQIEFRTGMGKDSIRKHRNALAEAGLIEYKDQPTPQPTLFRINIPAVLQLILKHVKMTRKRRATIGEQARPSIGEQARPSIGEQARPSIGEQARPLSYSKNIQESTKPPASEKQTRRKAGVGRGKRGSLPTCRIETDILCPPDFLTPELRAWAEREMPPVTLARFDSLLEQFLCDHREVKRDRLADAEAWRSRFKNFLRGCRDNDLRAEERRGRGYSSGAPAEESSPSFDTLVAAGIIDLKLTAAPRPTANTPPPAYVPSDKCSF
jgi:hypothetical protein